MASPSLLVFPTKEKSLRGGKKESRTFPAPALPTPGLRKSLLAFMTKVTWKRRFLRPYHGRAKCFHRKTRMRDAWCPKRAPVTPQWSEWGINRISWNSRDLYTRSASKYFCTAMGFKFKCVFALNTSFTPFACTNPDTPGGARLRAPFARRLRTTEVKSGRCWLKRVSTGKVSVSSFRRHEAVPKTRKPSESQENSLICFVLILLCFVWF